MNLKQKLTALLLLAVGAVTQLNAQVAVTVGSQVTDESNIVSGKAYILQSQAAGGNATLPYINDNGTYYAIQNGNACNESSVYYLISNGDGTWKIKNYYTNHFWGVPVYNQAIASVADEASAGAWSLNFSNGIAYPSAPDAESTIRGLDRSSNQLMGYTTGTGGTKQVKIYEISADEINLTFDKPGSATNNITVNVKDGSGNIVPGVTATLVSTSCTEFKTGSATALSRTTNSVLAPNAGYDNQQNSTITYTFKIDGLSTAFSYNTAALDVYALTGGGAAQGNNGSTVREWSFDVSTGSTEGGVSTYVSSTGNDICTVPDADGDLYHKVWKLNGTEQNVTAPIYIKVTLTKTASLGCFAGIGALKLYTTYTTSSVFTINNTNSNRGALIYNPENPKYVWSSGKSGTFDATNANSQWVICPAGIDGQYYLYNVGAGKFAIPTNIAQGASYSWIFSDNAVAVIFEDQGDGTKKIKMANNPVSGTNAAYMAVSNNYTGPIINYNDAGGNFTITKVDGQDQSTAANAAVNKLVKNASAALTAYPSTSGWYVIQIKSASNATGAVGRYVYSSSTLTNDLYPLTFTGGVDIQPSIADPTFLTYLDCRAWNDNDWQMPDGRYLVSNSNNKFPTCSSTASSIIAGYDGGNYFKSSANYFADPYLNSGNYFVGETGTFRTTWNVYPIDLTTAGLTAWQVICDNAPDNAQITCSRTDVSGLTAVYKNGFFFLPTGVTPESTDFNLDGATNVTVDASAHTITFAYDPSLALVEGSVTVEQGWQTAGRDSEVMLLRVTAKPFKDATNVSLTVSLKDGSAANIATLKLYEANNNSPEIYSTGDGAPTKTVVATATVFGSTATFNIGDLAAGTHYYWIGATVSSSAPVGAVLDAAVTRIAYQVAGQTEQNLDLTSVGDPADRGAMVFNVRSYPFLPRDNGSRVYRIPAMVVADDGSIVVAADKRYQSHTDIGGGHVIDIVIRRSTDGGKTWSDPIVVAKGLGTADDAKCGYGDPSLVKGKDGKLYCLFVAGNLGYFYGQKRIAMTTSSDNGVTWSSSESTPPIDLLESGRLQNYNTVGEAGYGLYDYFVTSGRGLYIPEDDILMYLIPAQTMTSATEHTGNSQNYIFYSTDGGDKWYFSPQIMFQGGDEAKIIQMNDGSLLGSVRQAYNRGFNTATYTKNNDGTLSFTMGTQWNNSQLNAGGSANNQDILYYQRETVTGKTDVIIHSMTTGSHANFKLYYSTDQGANWTEFLNVQTKGTRYVTMDRGGSEENPGSLYLFFEDQSLNSAGGYTDYNHYPLNFLEITRDQLESLIPTLNNYNMPEYMESEDVKIVYGTTAHTTYGTLSSLTWTSKVTSGVSTGDNTIAGLKMVASDGAFNQFSSWNSHYNIAYHPETANTDATLTLTAPEGYVIKSYSMLVAKGSSASHTYTVTNEAGTSTDVPFGSNASSYATVSQSDINKASTVITVNTSDVSKWLAIADFTVTLAKPLPLNVVGDASYATLYLPFDVTTTGATKAYYIETANNGYAQLTATGNEGTEIPANTAVVLVNSDAATSTILNMTTGLSSVVSESANLLKGTLVSMSLDLSDASSYYSLGQKNSVIGFYKFDNNGTTTITLGANKAYLNTTAASSGSVKGFRFDFETGIEDIENEPLTTDDVQIYNVAGQRMSKPRKGVNIINGKKVIIK